MRTHSGADRTATVPSRPWLHSRPLGHLHWFRYRGADAFSSATIYRCRCGQVRPGF